MRRLLVFIALGFASLGAAAPHIPSPKEFLGHDVCEDYWLANYKQLTAYWQALAKASNRFTFQSMGKTEDGREQWMAIVTDPSNRRGLENYRKASERLCLAKDFKDDAEAREFAKKQKAVVWIDGGIHATETLATQQLIETAYRLVSGEDPETKRIRKDCIILLAHANPDGMDWVSDWYMRRDKPTERSLSGLPFLYQKYCGHDDNRDYYANNMAETKNINRILYSTWYPQIVYNHHQSAPSGTLMFIPPFRNPFNYHMDPMIDIGTDLVGTHMHQRLIAEGKPGTAMRSSTLYSTWWNGGLRTTTYFHNMVGILTETWGSPNPAPLPFVAKFQIPTSDVPFPIEAGKMWHQRDSLEYEVSANYAVLDYASRYRERLLFDFYRAGRNSVERGSRDHWTPYPSRITALGAEALQKPELRDARMYVVPSDQSDFPTACKFIEKLMQCGVRVERIVGDSARWPSGSFVVRCDQAFRPHILDMFEPQDHPNDFQYPGGPPIPPYDSAGYTLAFQMGVKFDRVLDPLEIKTEPVKDGVPQQFFESNGAGWVKTSNYNYREVNLALKKGERVFDGTVFTKTPLNHEPQLSKPRVALWDRYGGSMESGWTRWVLEQFAFDFTLVYPPELDAGYLNDKYDCIIFPSGGIPAAKSAGQDSQTQSASLSARVSPPAGSQGEFGGFFASIQPQSAPAQSLADDPTIPLEWRQRIGNVSAKTVAKLREFVEKGGHLLCIGSSALNIARQFKLPVESALVDDKGAALPSTKFYIPGSILKMKLNSGPLTMGMEDSVDVMFDNSPAFRLAPPPSPLPASGEGEPDVVGYYDSGKPLRSGWAWGQEVLKGALGVVDLPVGKGRVVLYGPEILFRGQSFGTFKLLFNAIFRSAQKTVR